MFFIVFPFVAFLKSFIPTKPKPFSSHLSFGIEKYAPSEDEEDAIERYLKVNFSLL